MKAHNAPNEHGMSRLLHPAIPLLPWGSCLFTAGTTYSPTQTRQSYKQMLRNQNNLCARLGSFTSLQNREELSYTPDVCFMTQWPRLISWWVSADVTDRGKPFAGPLCRAGHNPSTCIISLSSNCFCIPIQCDFCSLNTSPATAVPSSQPFELHICAVYREWLQASLRGK